MASVTEEDIGSAFSTTEDDRDRLWEIQEENRPSVSFDTTLDEVEGILRSLSTRSSGAKDDAVSKARRQGKKPLFSHLLPFAESSCKTAQDAIDNAHTSTLEKSRNARARLQDSRLVSAGIGSCGTIQDVASGSISNGAAVIAKNLSSKRSREEKLLTNHYELMRRGHMTFNDIGQMKRDSLLVAIRLASHGTPLTYSEDAVLNLKKKGDLSYHNLANGCYKGTVDKLQAALPALEQYRKVLYNHIRGLVKAEKRDFAKEAAAMHEAIESAKSWCTIHFQDDDWKEAVKEKARKSRSRMFRDVKAYNLALSKVTTEIKSVQNIGKLSTSVY